MNGSRPPPSFRRSAALLIAVDAYGDGVPPLRTPVADAQALAATLEGHHGYEVEILANEGATLASVRERLADLRFELGGEDRLIVYFAGHGVAVDGEAGPEGFLLPFDAAAGVASSFLPMVELHRALAEVPCRHMLLILDCCFAGAFRWSSGRDFRELPRVLHAERYSWFVRDPAWQVLASAAHDQKALDVVAGEPVGDRGEAGRQHSPFAAALLDGLAGAADAPLPGGQKGDGIVTASELYIYLRDRLLPSGPTARARQTPSLWPLAKHDKGEFVFAVPGAEPQLPEAPPVSVELNPWRGLRAYGEADAELYFGRARAADRLAHNLKAHRFAALVGPSGSGKSSLLQAGLVPRLTAADPRLRVAALRPGERPAEAFGEALLGLGSAALPMIADRARIEAHVDALLGPDEPPLLLVIDQLEELITTAHGEDALPDFCALLASALDRHPERLLICVAVRSDFEAAFLSTHLGERWRTCRQTTPTMTQDELRRCIEGPASVRVMRFEGEGLVDELINEVVQAPAPLPLLSFVLSEMYLRAVSRGDADRTLLREDYDALGGVTGALQYRANQEYQRDPELQPTFQRVLLRMISLEGGEVARRRIDVSELHYADPDEDARVQVVLERLTQARLVVTDQVAGVPLVEPAHEALIRGWDRLGTWIRHARSDFPLARGFGADAVQWAGGGRPEGQLWHQDVRLAQVEALAARGEALRLNALENEFLRASLARRERDRKRRLGYVSAAAVGAVVAAGAVGFLSVQGKQRATTATLLARTTEITARLDGPRQLDGLLSAIDAAALAEKTFGRMPPVVRGGFLRALERARESDRWEAAPFRITELVVSPDAREILGVYQPDSETASSRPIVVRAWALKPPHRARDIRVPGPVTAVALCPSGACFAVDRGGEVEVYNPDGRSVWSGLRATAPAAVDADSQGVLVSGAANGVLRRLGHGTAGVLARAPGPISHLRVSAEGGRILVQVKGKLYVFEVASRRWTELAIPTGLDAEDYAFSADGTYVLFPGGSGEVMRARSDGSPPELAIRRGGQRVDRIAASRAGRQFAFTSATEGAIYVVDESLGLRFGGPLYGGATPAIAFSPDGRTLVESGSLDRQLKTFDLAQSAFPGRTVKLDRRLTAATLCDRGRALVWGDDAGRVGVVPVIGGAPRERKAHGDYVERIRCIDGRRFVSAGRDGHLMLWNDVSLAPPKLLGPRETHFRDVAATNGGQSLLATQGPWVWKLDLSGRGRRFFRTDLDDINRIAVGRHGAIALGSSGSGQVTLFDAEGHRRLAPYSAHMGLVMALAYSPWDDTLASGGTIGTTNLLSLSLWGPAGEQRESVSAHPTIVTAVAFAPRDRLIVSGGTEGALRLWDENLLQIGPDLAHMGEIVGGVDVAEDRTLLAATGSDGAVAILDLEDASLLRHACVRIRAHSRLREPRSELERRVRDICGRIVP